MEAKNELVSILQEVRGEKALVVDPQISGVFTLISGISFLKEKGVFKVYSLSPELDTPPRTVVYLVRPKPELMRHIAAHIKSHQERGIRKEYAVYFVPRRTMLCERALEEMGVYGDVSVGEYPLDLVPFDDDVLSMQMASCYKECYLDGDRTCLFYLAKSLMKLQALYGLIPSVRGKGIMAKLVAEMMLKMRREVSKDDVNLSSEIDTLILFDRQLDMVTPMCTQLTYEGLIDEIIGVNNCKKYSFSPFYIILYIHHANTHILKNKAFVLLDKSLLGLEMKNNQFEKVPTPLNSNDPVLMDIRDVNFFAVGPVLNARAKNIQEFEHEFERKKNQITHEELKDSVKILPDRACLPIRS